MVFGGDDDGYTQPRLQRIAAGKKVEASAGNHGAVGVAAVVVALDHGGRNFHDFGSLIVPGRVFVNTPEIEYFWQVDDFLGAFAGAKNQIVVLRNPQALVKAANVTQQLSAKANHVHDVRMAAQVFW